MGAGEESIGGGVRAGVAAGADSRSALAVSDWNWRSSRRVMRSPSRVLIDARRPSLFRHAFGVSLECVVVSTIPSRMARRSMRLFASLSASSQVVTKL